MVRAKKRSFSNQSHESEEQQLWTTIKIRAMMRKDVPLNAGDVAVAVERPLSCCTVMRQHVMSHVGSEKEDTTS
jgi:hypothetical protein